MSIKYQNLHSFKEGLIVLCQSILEMRRITDLHGSIYSTIPLTNITNFHVAKIDVLHRTLTWENAPIIILFTKTSDRMNLFRESQKLKGVTESQLLRLIKVMKIEK